MRLPKQWKQWIKKAGLKPEAFPMRKWAQYSLVGRGRRWRVNCYGEFQMSEVLATFDRWANSLEKSADVFPKTEREFVALVKQMAYGD